MQNHEGEKYRYIRYSFVILIIFLLFLKIKTNKCCKRYNKCRPILAIGLSRFYVEQKQQLLSPSWISNSVTSNDSATLPGFGGHNKHGNSANLNEDFMGSENVKLFIIYHITSYHVVTLSGWPPASFSVVNKLITEHCSVWQYCEADQGKTVGVEKD